MIEVAKRAGVSTATISRVINRQSGVSEATAANVRRAMAELGYTPPASRRGPKLGSRRSPRLLNVLFVMFARGSSNRTTGFQRLMSGASSQLDETSANLTVKFVSTPDEVRALALSQSNVDGILAHGTSPEGDVVSQFRDVPTVWLMGNPVRPTWGDQVMPDSDAIGTIAARHLSESGCKEVAHLNLLPGSWALSLHSRAFLDSAVELGIRAESFESSNPIGSSFFDDYAPDSSGRIVEAADRLVDDLLNRMPKVRGIFIAEDRQASVLVPALQRRGIALALEDDISVISCNNERPYLMGLHPCPATIDIHTEIIGQRGAAQLLWRIAEGSTKNRMCTTIEPGLVLAGRNRADDVLS